MVNLNLNSKFKAPWENKDERMVLAAVQNYYTAMGRAISEGDPSIFEEKYGYLSSPPVKVAMELMRESSTSPGASIQAVWKSTGIISLRCWSPSLR